MPVSRYRRRPKTSGILGFISFLVIMSFLGEILEAGIGVIGGLFGLMTAFVFLAIPVAAFVGMIVAISKLISNISNRNKKVARSATSISTKELLEDLGKYFAENSQLAIDKDTYLIRTDNASNTLTSYDIIMNDEYVSDLKLFANSFPSGFNSFANLVHELTNPKKKSTKTKTVDTPASAEKKEEKPKEEITDCAYYIGKISALNNNIANPDITNGLNETVEYLKQIKKIEDEFSECRTKTTKLYQYYLPMLCDILQNYNRLSINASNHEDFKANEDRLLKTIVLINGALRTISSSLVEDYYTDLKVDMKTLESVLKKDGLVEQMKEDE